MEKNQLAISYLENLNKENLISQNEILSMESLLGSKIVTENKKITHFTKNRSSINVSIVKTALETFIQDMQKQNRIDLADKESKLNALKAFVNDIKFIFVRNKENKIMIADDFNRIIPEFENEYYPMGNGFIPLKDCPFLHYLKGYNTTEKSNLNMILDNIYSIVRNMTSYEGLDDFFMNFNREGKVDELKSNHALLPKVIEMVEDKVKLYGKYNSISIISSALFSYLKTLTDNNEETEKLKNDFETTFTSEAINNCSLKVIYFIARNQDLVLRALKHYILLMQQPDFEMPEIVNNLYFGGTDFIPISDDCQIYSKVELDAMGIFSILSDFGKLY